MPAPRLHAFARLLIATVGTIAISFVVVIVVATATSVAATVMGQDAEKQVERFFNDNLLLLNLFVYPPILLWLWFCRRFFDRRTFISLGLRAQGMAGQFAGGIACGFLAVAFTFAVLWLSGNLQVEGWSVAAQTGGLQTAAIALLGWALMMLCVGFMEEVAFRGYAFHNLNIWLGGRWANVLQAVVFALIHLGNLAAADKSTPDAALASALAMPNITLIGIFFALCYLKTGSLWFPIAFHAAWNFFLGCVFSMPVSGIPIFQLLDVKVSGSVFLTGAAFGPEASLLLTPILLALIFAVMRSPNHSQALADLKSLTVAPDPEAIDEPAPAIMETEVELENRFHTRMGARRDELDEETRQTIRQINQAPRPPTLETPSTFEAPVQTDEVHEEPANEEPVPEPPVEESPAEEPAPPETPSTPAPKPPSQPL